MGALAAAPAGVSEAAVIAEMRRLGAQARVAATALGTAAPAAKEQALRAAAAALRRDVDALLAANAEDLAAAPDTLTAAFADRLTLTPERIEGMAAGLQSIAAQDDPVGSEIAAWSQPSGLKIRRVRTPLGVIGVIYESRPNVTADAGGLSLKAGNAVILRGGSESFHSARAIHARLVDGLRAAGLPEASIQLVPTRDRAAVGAMLAHMADQIDVIVPRGGRSLVERVQSTARVPVFAHLDGVCHVYAHRAADLDMARQIVLNAKLRRTGVCGAAECLLVDAEAAPRLLAPLVTALLDAGCAVRGDAATLEADPRAVAAAPEDYGREFLDAVIAVRVVGGLDAAIDHVRRFGSGHTDAIISDDAAAAARFQREVDSAIVLWNASTQFADGGEFGMGAEIGIATGKMHARGPVGAQQLTSFKYIVDGGGAIRP